MFSMCIRISSFLSVIAIKTVNVSIVMLSYSPQGQLPRSGSSWRWPPGKQGVFGDGREAGIQSSGRDGRVGGAQGPMCRRDWSPWWPWLITIHAYSVTISSERGRRFLSGLTGNHLPFLFFFFVFLFCFLFFVFCFLFFVFCFLFFVFCFHWGELKVFIIY